MKENSVKQILARLVRLLAAEEPVDLSDVDLTITMQDDSEVKLTAEQLVTYVEEGRL